MFQNPFFFTPRRERPPEGIEDNVANEKAEAAQAMEVIVPLPSPRSSHDTLSHEEHDSTFLPQIVTLAAGASYVAVRSVRPRSWVAYLDKASTTALIKVYPNADAGAHFVTLSPGQMVKFPARSQSFRVTNSGTGNGDVSLIALGDDAFDIR